MLGQMEMCLISRQRQEVLYSTKLKSIETLKQKPPKNKQTNKNEKKKKKKRATPVYPKIKEQKYIRGVLIYGLQHVRIILLLSVNTVEFDYK